MKTIFKFLASSILLASTILILGASNANDWSLVYSNNASGIATYGNISALVNAIKNGADVKVQMGATYIAKCDEIHINPDNSISCSTLQNISIRSTQPGSAFGFQDDAYHWYAMVNTKGQRDMIRWSVGDHIDRGRNSDTTPLNWFVDN
jgi:hypothetical protein